jgi:hypothetical protein
LSSTSSDLTALDVPDVQQRCAQAVAGIVINMREFPRDHWALARLLVLATRHGAEVGFDAGLDAAQRISGRVRG